MIDFVEISYITSKQLLKITNKEGMNLMEYWIPIDIVIKKLFKKRKTLPRPLLYKRVYFCEKNNKNIYETYQIIFI